MIQIHFRINAIHARGRKCNAFFFDIGIIGHTVFECCLHVIKCLSLQLVTLRPTFELRPFRVEFVVDKRELEQISLRVLQFYGTLSVPFHEHSMLILIFKAFLN
jgi:hypothetical protein